MQGEAYTNKLKSDTELTALKTKGEIEIHVKMMELFPELFRQDAVAMTGAGKGAGQQSVPAMGQGQPAQMQQPMPEEQMPVEAGPEPGMEMQ